MKLDTLKELICLQSSDEDTREKQLKILRKCRSTLLNEIHTKQQRLDQLDYLIYEIGHVKE